MTDRPFLMLGLALAASLALNGHQCKRMGAIEERERGKDEVIAELRKEPEWLGKVLVQHAVEQVDIEAVRKAARRGVREEIRANPVFKTWHGGLLPASVAPGGGLLGAARPGSHPADAAGAAPPGAAGPGLAGNDQR